MRLIQRIFCFLMNTIAVLVASGAAIMFFAALDSHDSDGGYIAACALIVIYLCYKFLRRKKKTDKPTEKKAPDHTDSPKKPLDLSVAVFGKSGAGKTILLSSFFGYHQDEMVEEKNGYSLSIDGLKEGNELLKIYHSIQTKCALNISGSNSYRRYVFKLKIPNIKQVSRLEWHDYPGGWLENAPMDAGEAEERLQTFERLINCHVAFLLIDGLELSSYEGSERSKYIGFTLDQFKHAFNNIYDTAKKPVLFPKIWVLCVSKSDLLSSYTCEDFYRDVKMVGPKLESLKAALQAASQTPGIEFSFGEHFLLLSSALIDKYGNVIDPDQKAGIDLMSPLGLRLPLCYKYRYRTLIDKALTLGSIPADVMLWLSTEAVGSDAVGVAIKSLLKLSATQLSKKAQEAKERNRTVEAVFLTMLENLQLAEDSGMVYFYKTSIA